MDKAKLEAQFPQSDEILSWVKHFCSFGHRRSGTPQNAASAEFIREKFLEFGLEDVKIEHPAATFYFPEEWELFVDGTEFPCYYINFAYENDKEGTIDSGWIEREIVDVGDGREEDFDRVDVKGKIVLSTVRWNDYTLDYFEQNHASSKCFWYDERNTISSGSQYIEKDSYTPNTFPFNFYRAIDRGAAGFVAILSDNCNHYEHHCENYNNEFLRNGHIMNYDFDRLKIPGLFIRRTDGDRIKEMICEGKNTAKMRLKTTTKYGGANIVSGILPGESDEIILVHSHHDSCFEGAAQDATGMSAVLAIAKYYGSLPKSERKKTLMFGAMDSHFSAYAGHKGFIQNRKNDGSNIILDFSIEHIAMEAVDDKRYEDEMHFTGEIGMRLNYVTENRHLVPIVENAIKDFRLDRTLLVPVLEHKGEVCSDANQFWHAGIPVVSIISPVIYLMDPVDTFEVVATKEIRKVPMAFAAMVEEASQYSAEELKDEPDLNYFS